MESNRRPTLQELKLLELLINVASLKQPKNWKEKLMVRTMEDGKMGSLHLFPDGEIKSDRIFGKQVSDFQFTDLDGIEVLVTLNVDKNDELFELDIWKTDFSLLLKLPDV